MRPGGIVVRAVPDGTQKFPLDGRLCVRPVRNIDHGFLHTALNDVERISTNKDVDLTLRQFRCPAEERGDEVMIRHSTPLEVLRRCEIIGQTMQSKPECCGNLGSIARHLRPLDVDMDGRIEQHIPAIRSLDRLHDAPLTCFLDEKTEGIIHHPPLNAVANGKRPDGFKLNVIRETEFAERHGERTNPPLLELCIGQCMRNLDFRVCNDA